MHLGPKKSFGAGSGVKRKKERKAFNYRRHTFSLIPLAAFSQCFVQNNGSHSFFFSTGAEGELMHHPFIR